MEINPWKVDSLEAFVCLKCPECTYFSKEEINFKNHAIESHPLSSVFFEQSESQVVIASEENSTLDNISGKEFSKQSIPTTFYTGKSLSEALLFAKHRENMLCTKIVLNVRNNICTQHVLPRFELEIFMY